MPNEYTDILREDSAERDPAQAPVVNEYDSLLKDEAAQDKAQVQQSLFRAGFTDPSRQADVLNTAKKLNVAPATVDTQLDEAKKKAAQVDPDYDAIVKDTPGLKEYLKNPDNASLSRDDLDTLAKMDKTGQSFRQDAQTAVEHGFLQLGRMSAFVAAASGLADPDTAIKAIQRTQEKIDAVNKNRPAYANEYDAMAAKEKGDLSTTLGSLKEDLAQASTRGATTQTPLQIIKNIFRDGTSTVGEALDLAYKAVKNYKGFIYSNLEFAPQMAPGLAAGLSGGRVGGPVGGILSGFLANTAVFVGNDIEAALTKKGVDTRNPEALRKAFADPALMSDVRAAAVRGGVTTSLAMSLFESLGASIMGKELGEGAGALAKVEQFAKSTASNMAGQTAGPIAGQMAREKSVTNIDYADHLFSGLLSLGASMAHAGIAKTWGMGKEALRDQPEAIAETLPEGVAAEPGKRGVPAEGVGGNRHEYSPDVVTAIGEISEDANSAVKSLQDAQLLSELGQRVAELQHTQKVPGKISEFIRNSVGDSKVYFDTKKWTEFWNSQGLSPATAAEQIMGDGAKAYLDGQNENEHFGVPIGDFIEHASQTPQFQQLIGFAKIGSPEGMSAEEAHPFLTEQLHPTMQQLAQEAEAAQEPRQGLDPNIQPLAQQMEEQLVAAGRPQEEAQAQAQLFGSSLEAMRENYGADIDKLILPEVTGEPANAEPPAEIVTTGPLTADEEVQRLRAENKALATELRTSEKTGLKNRKAFHEDNRLSPPALTGAMDIDGFGRLNDVVGHETADIILHTLGGELLRFQKENPGITFYHLNGDEFAVRMDDPVRGPELLKKAQEELDNIRVNLESQNGKRFTYDGIGLSFGTGENYDAADKNSYIQKAERIRAGLREDKRQPGPPRRLREDAGTGAGGQNSEGNVRENRAQSSDEQVLNSADDTHLQFFQENNDFQDKLNAKIIDASSIFRKKAKEEGNAIPSDGSKSKRPPKPIDSFLNRFTEKEEKAAIRKAQSPKLGPYPPVPEIKSIGWVPNYEARPTGVIGPERISKPHELGTWNEGGGKQLTTGARPGRETDPLKWADSKYGVTKDLIRKHGIEGIPLTINTSSDLIGHNDYIKALPPRTKVRMWLLTENDQINRILFPGNPSRLRQEEAIKHLQEKGIDAEGIEPSVQDIIDAAGGRKEAGKRLGVRGEKLTALIEAALHEKGRDFFTEKGLEMPEIKKQFETEKKGPFQVITNLLGAEASEKKGTVSVVKAPVDPIELARILEQKTPLSKRESETLQRRMDEIAQSFLKPDLADWEQNAWLAEEDKIKERLRQSEGMSKPVPDQPQEQEQGRPVLTRHGLAHIVSENGNDLRIIHVGDGGRERSAHRSQITEITSQMREAVQQALESGMTFDTGLNWNERYRTLMEAAQSNDPELVVKAKNTLEKLATEKELGFGEKVILRSATAWIDGILSTETSASPSHVAETQPSHGYVDLKTAAEMRKLFRGKEAPDLTPKQVAEMLASDDPMKIAMAAHHLDLMERESSLNKHEQEQLRAASKKIQEFLPPQKAIRFGTPDGNLWLVRTTDENGKEVMGYGSSKVEAEEAILKGGLDHQTAPISAVMLAPWNKAMLAVGANNYMRQHIPYFVLQQYDAHLLFIPSQKEFKLGLALLDRTDRAKSQLITVTASDIKTGLQKLFAAATDSVGAPQESDESSPTPKNTITRDRWAQNDIYRKPKVALKDLLSIEPISPDKTFEQGPRGKISFRDGGINIKLLAKADPSTFFHEMGHYYLEQLAKLAEHSDQATADLKTILDWFGVESWDKVKDEQHEQFARGFEKHLATGEAPTPKLKALFEQFKVWLASIYKNLDHLNVELTPEVRDVMNRMLAPEKEIPKVEQEYGPPNPFGMVGPKAEEFAKAVADADKSAKEILTRKLMKDFEKKQEGEYQSRKELVQQEVEGEVDALPSYKLIKAVDDGAAPKLSYQEILKGFGSKYLENLPEGIVSKDEGISPALLYDSFGFKSPKEMLDALSKSPPREDLVSHLTEQRMQERYPDLMMAGLSDEAVKAFHNEKHAQILRMQLEHLAEHNMSEMKAGIRAISRRVPTDSEVKNQAQTIIGSKQMSEVKPNLYSKAASKYAKESGELFAKGDFAGAFESKRKELLNHELFRAATDAVDNVDKAEKLFKKILGTDEKLSKSRNMDYVNAARAIISDHGYGKASKSAADYLAPIERYDSDTYETLKNIVDSVPPANSPEGSTLGGFMKMYDTVKALWSLAKADHEILVDGKRVDKAVALEAMGSQLSELGIKGNGDKYMKQAPTWQDKGAIRLMGIRSSLRRVEHWVDSMDLGNPDGPFRRYVWAPVSDAATQYRTEKARVLKQYVDLVKAVEPSLTHEPIEAPELGYTFKDKGQLLGALMHSGNDSNLSKLLRGYKWGDLNEDGSLNRLKWDQFMRRAMKDGTITKTDMDFVQGVWNLMEGLKPALQEAHKEMYGYYFNEVTSSPIQTPFGEYKGGYFPAKVDTFLVESGASNFDKELLKSGQNAFAFPTTGRGATMTRVEQYAAPLALDLKLAPAHLDWAMRFLHIEPRVKEVGRLLFDSKTRDMLRNIDPTVMSDMLIPWLQRSASQRLVTPIQGEGGKAATWFAQALRRNTGLQVMSVNVINTLHQLTGVFIANTRVPMEHLRNGLWEYTRGPKAMSDMIMEKSDFMKNRMDHAMADMMNDMDEVLLNPNTFQKTEKWLTKNAYFLQRATHNVIDNVAWFGSYEHSIESGKTEAEAIKIADADVRLTRGSGSVEDVSRFETGNAIVRLFSQFASHFNMQANLLGTEFAKIARTTGLKKGAGKALLIYTTGFMIPAVLSELFVRAGGGSIHDKDDDNYLSDAMDIFFGSQFRAATAMLPIVGPAIRSTINTFKDKAFDERLTSSPSISAIESAIKAPHDLYKTIIGEGKAKSTIRDTLTLLGLLSGLPAAPLAKPLGYLSDVSQGNAQPTGPIDFTRGLLTGKTPQYQRK